MKFFSVWENTFVPFLAGIPLLILILFACCTCVDKSVVAVRRAWVSYKCKPRTPRRVRFDVESQPNQSGDRSDQKPLLTRTATQPRLSGLMAHSSYVQRNSSFRYVNERSPGRTRASSSGSDRDSISSSLDREPLLSSSSHTVTYHGSRRSSTPTPLSPSPLPPHRSSSVRSKSPMQMDNYSTERFSRLDVHKPRRYSSPNSPTAYHHQNYHYGENGPTREDSNYSSISFLPEVRAYLQFMEADPNTRQRSYSFSGRNSSRNSSRRSSRRSSRHRPRSRSPSPYALERTERVPDPDEVSNFSGQGSYGRYLTPQGSSDQGSFKSPESGTPDWMLKDEDVMPPSYQDCLTNLSRSSSIRTSFI